MQTFIKCTDAACTTSGSWTPLSQPSYTGTDKQSTTSGNYALFTFNGLTAGTPYYLHFTYVPWTSRSTAVPWQILDSNGTSVIASGTINEQINPIGATYAGSATVQFRYLGSASPSGTGTTLYLKISAGASGVTDVDAAMLQDGSIPVTYGTIASGNWSSSSTWTAGHVPGASDYCSIGHAVTITANTTIGDGTASPVLAIGTDSYPAVNISAGLLTITGATLTIRGNSRVGSRDPSYTLSTRLTVQNSGGTPGGIVFDGNSGVTPTMTIDDCSLFVISGTSSARCFIRTKAAAKGDGGNSAGNNAQITGNFAGYMNWYAQWQYFDLYKLGDSSNAGVYSPVINGSVTGVTNAPFTWDHFTVDSCGQTPKTGITGATPNIRFTNGIWTNQLSQYGQTITADTTTLSSGTRLIDHCVFMGRAYFFAPGNFKITNCYFADNVTGSSGPGNWSVFDGNFITRTNDDGEECLWSGSTTNCYTYTTQVTSQMMGLLNSSADLTFAGNVGENAGTGVIGYTGATEEATGPQTYIVDNNIAFNSSTGSFSPFFGMSSNPAHYPPAVQYLKARHNTVVTNGQSPFNGAAMMTGTIPELRANVLVNTGSTVGSSPYNGVYVFDNTSRIWPAYGYVVDELPASAVLSNCWKNFGSVATGSFQTVAPIVSGAVAAVTDGTRYYSAMSTGTPGFGDLANVDPQFYDSTRNLATWDSVVMGGPGTAAHAKTLLQATPTLVKSSLLPWVRAGYAPKNAALRGASYSGDTSTTDAAGNAWPGGTPGIGAMGVVSTSSSSSSPVPGLAMLSQRCK
jgi:hypothetical protein